MNLPTQSALKLKPRVCSRKQAYLYLLFAKIKKVVVETVLPVLRSAHFLVLCRHECNTLSRVCKSNKAGGFLFQ